MFAQGHTYAEIGKQFGVSRQRIQQIVKPPVQVLAALRRRSGDKCERCRVSLLSGEMHIHHIDKNITGTYEDLKRVRLLCPSCHKIEDFILEPHKLRRHPDTTTGPCKVSGCFRKGHGKDGKLFTDGYCSAHYHRLLKYGDLEERPMGRKRRNAGKEGKR